LIPYLSESIRANYNDIQDLTSKADRISKAIDAMYEEFIKKDKQKTSSTMDPMSFSVPRGTTNKFISTKLGRWTIGLLGAFAVIATVLAVVLFTSGDNGTTPSGVLPIVELIPVSQAQALRDIYEATNGPFWAYVHNWMTPGVAPCRWTGVYCENGVVIGLDLSRYDVQGTLPASIGNLVNLTRLQLSSNNIAGTLPESLSKMRDLQELLLANNDFEGTIPEGLFTSLPNLHVVDLSINRLTGSITPSISNHTTLFELNLSRNKLTGTVPDMPHLAFKVLDLSYNRLEGPLPQLHMFVESINVEGNRMSGGVDSLVSFLPFLHTLKVGGNMFDGILMVSEFQLLTTMKSFNISHNNFTMFSLSSDTNKTPQFNLCDASDVPFKCPVPNWLIARCRATCVKA
jgi:hypothetical protein